MVIEYIGLSMIFVAGVVEPRAIFAALAFICFVVAIFNAIT